MANLFKATPGATPSMLLGRQEIADDLVDRIRGRAATLVIGDGKKAESEMGSSIAEESLNRVAGYVAGAAKEGATVVLGG